MAIDDSESMADCGAGALALAAMTTVASGLTQLEAGQLAVARYVSHCTIVHVGHERVSGSILERAPSQHASGEERDNAWFGSWETLR